MKNPFISALDAIQTPKVTAKALRKPPQWSRSTPPPPANPGDPLVAPSMIKEAQPKGGKLQLIKASCLGLLRWQTCIQTFSCKARKCSSNFDLRKTLVSMGISSGLPKIIQLHQRQFHHKVKAKIVGYLFEKIRPLASKLQVIQFCKLQWKNELYRAEPPTEIQIEWAAGHFGNRWSKVSSCPLQRTHLGSLVTHLFIQLTLLNTRSCNMSHIKTCMRCCTTAFQTTSHCLLESTSMSLRMIFRTCLMENAHFCHLSNKSNLLHLDPQWVHERLLVSTLH